MSDSRQRLRKFLVTNGILWDNFYLGGVEISTWGFSSQHPSSLHQHCQWQRDHLAGKNCLGIQLQEALACEQAGHCVWARVSACECVGLFYVTGLQLWTGLTAPALRHKTECERVRSAMKETEAGYTEAGSKSLLFVYNIHNVYTVDMCLL